MAIGDFVVERRRSSLGRESRRMPPRQHIGPSPPPTGIIVPSTPASPSDVASAPSRAIDRTIKTPAGRACIDRRARSINVDVRGQVDVLGHRLPRLAAAAYTVVDTSPVALAKARRVHPGVGIGPQADGTVEQHVVDVKRAVSPFALLRRRPVHIEQQLVPQPARGVEAQALAVNAMPVSTASTVRMHSRQAKTVPRQCVVAAQL